MREAITLPPTKRHLCALYAREARDMYPECTWLEIEPLIRRAWERGARNAAWSNARSMVHAFWANA